MALSRIVQRVARPFAARGIASSAVARDSLDTITQDILREAHETGTFKVERVITSQQKPKMRVQGSAEDVICMCSNNYLALCDDPRLIKAAKDALDTHGLGLSSVRFICGTQDIHKELEGAISKFHGTDDTILYPSCFDANAGLFEAILDNRDAVISDQLNHASIIDGIRLCKAERHRYNHLDMLDLEEKLKATQHARVRLIATDGVFSMDGDVAPLKEIVRLAEMYDAKVFVDECHATGFFGATGRGTDEYWNVMGKVDIINSTLGKALGGATGGYTTGRQGVVDVLRQKARPYLFSNTLAPPVVGASLEVFKILSEDASLPAKVQASTHYFRDRMTEAGFTITGAQDCPIVPVMLGDARLASEFADEMLQRGIYVIAFSYPVVPKGAARIRTQISAGHTQEQLDQAIDAFIAVGKAKGVIQ